MLKRRPTRVRKSARYMFSCPVISVAFAFVRFLIILLELLYQMLRETHPFPKRMVLLTRDSGKLLLSLAHLIIAIPPLTMHTDPGEPEVCIQYNYVDLFV